ncbi:MAG: Abi family protein [Mycoplasmataceae bacterium]|nr:Abi family protein [Mycoplasmataceae bacterium]
MFKNNLLHYCDKERRLTENYEKVDDIPIWKMSLYWTLGLSVEIYESLNKSIRRKIVESFQHCGDDTETTNFFWILKMLNKVRNLLSHNKKIFDFHNKDGKSKIYKYMEQNAINISKPKKEIRLFEMCNIIDFLNPTTNKHKGLALSSYIPKMYGKYIVQKGIDVKIDGKIKNICNF